MALEKKNKENENPTIISLKSMYKVARFFKYIPNISVTKKSMVIVIGLDTFRMLDNDIKQNTHIVLTPKDIFKIRTKEFYIFVNFSITLSVFYYIWQSMNNIQTQKNNKILEKILIKCEPQMVVVNSTINPFSKLWIDISTDNNIKTGCYQHGIFSSTNTLNDLEKNIVDRYFFRGVDQYNILKNIFPDDKLIDIYVQNSFLNSIKNKEVYNICFIGTDYERYGLKGIEKKNVILKSFKSVVEGLNLNNKNLLFKFFYKKHPAEKISFKKSGLSVKVIKKKDFNVIDIFIGISSTLLVDLAAEKKCAVQIRVDALPRDDYELSGYCKSYSLEEFVKTEIFKLIEEEVSFPYSFKRKITFKDILV